MRCIFFFLGQKFNRMQNEIWKKRKEKKMKIVSFSHLTFKNVMLDERIFTYRFQIRNSSHNFKWTALYFLPVVWWALTIFHTVIFLLTVNFVIAFLFVSISCKKIIYLMRSFQNLDSVEILCVCVSLYSIETMIENRI